MIWRKMENTGKLTTIISWVRFDRALVMKLWTYNYGFATGNVPLFYGNNIVACSFLHFAANDIKGWQVATGNKASWSWQQHKLNVKTWSPNFHCALLNW